MILYTCETCFSGKSYFWNFYFQTGKNCGGWRLGKVGVIEDESNQNKSNKNVAF